MFTFSILQSNVVVFFRLINELLGPVGRVKTVNSEAVRFSVQRARKNFQQRLIFTHLTL